MLIYKGLYKKYNIPFINSILCRGEHLHETSPNLFECRCEKGLNSLDTYLNKKFHFMPGVGIEPTKTLSHRILSPAPLTAREPRHAISRKKRFKKVPKENK